jgi:hypothetical protein
MLGPDWIGADCRHQFTAAGKQEQRFGFGAERQCHQVFVDLRNFFE